MLKLSVLTSCCLVLALAQGSPSPDIQNNEGLTKRGWSWGVNTGSGGYGGSITNTFGHNSVTGYGQHTGGGNIYGLSATHNFGHKSGSATGYVETNPGGNAYGGSLNKNFGSGSVGGYLDHNSNGNSYGIQGSANLGSGSLTGHFGKTPGGGTNVGLDFSKNFKHSDGSVTKVSAGFSKDSRGGTNGGLSITQTFGRRMAQLERAVRDLEE